MASQMGMKVPFGLTDEQREIFWKVFDPANKELLEAIYEIIDPLSQELIHKALEGEPESIMNWLDLKAQAATYLAGLKRSLKSA